MTYVMSDIHGESDKFFEMLNLINFNENDQLVIIGDVIDRGAGGVDVLRWVMDAPNIHMILGNHEQMMLDVLWHNSDPLSRQMWAANGGNITRREMLYHRTSVERNAMLKYVSNLPVDMTVEVNGRSYYLVHGFPSAKDIDKVWSRPDADTVYHGDAMAIVGHTPTCYITNDYKSVMQIYHGSGWICIDCGCGNMAAPNRKLACLRLDDMNEFYH